LVSDADAAPGVLPNAVATQASTEQGPVLRGFDLDVTLWSVSGIQGAEESYENQLSLYLQPAFNLGKQFFRGRWAEPISIRARLLVEGELAGNSASFRGSGFASPGLLREVPEQVAIAQSNGASATPFGRVEGPRRRVAISDLWLSVQHDRVVTIPKLGIDVAVGARVVLPTSLESRIAGLYVAPSLNLGLTRRVWWLTFNYGLRATKYFYATKVNPIGAIDGGTVLVNGQPVTPDTLGSTGILNPEWSVVNSFSAVLSLPKGFSFELDYFLFNTFTYQLDQCRVAGVPTADVCADGLALGDVRRPGPRDSQWFLAELGYQPVSYLTLGLGLSTFGPVRKPDGSIANPFVRVSRDNLTTVYLALSINAEALANAARKRRSHR